MSDDRAANTQIVSANWSLNESAKDFIGISRGIVQAATTDNVQPLALAAVEAFGTTVAIAPRNLVLVEKVAGRRGTSAVLQFLQAQVGWRANDSSSHLAKSDGGLRFLDTGLAAEGSAGRDQLMPTLGQLQDLMAAVAPKLWQAGFADRTVGADALIIGLMKCSPDSMGLTLSKRPSSQQIVKLLTAFTTFGRIGEISSSKSDDAPAHLIITTSVVSASAWIYALVDWCLGAPPSLRNADGEQLLTQSTPNAACQVTLICRDPRDYPSNSEMKIEVYHSIGSPKELWHTSEGFGDIWSGFLAIPMFAERRLRASGAKDASAFEAVAITVAYVLCALQLGAFPSNVRPEFTQYGLPVLLPAHNIDLAYRQYMGREMPDVTDLLDARPPMDELLEFATQLRSLKRDCRCQSCKGLEYNKKDRILCRLATFRSSIAETSANILTLALFEDLDHNGILVDSTTVTLRDNKLQMILDDFIRDLRRPIEIDPQFHPLRKRAHEMLRIPTGLIGEPALVGCNGGQVVYLSRLNSQRFDGSNLSLLKCISGQLLYRNEQQQFVIGSPSSTQDTSELHGLVDRPRNLRSSGDQELRWTVSQQRGKYLSLSVSLDEHMASPAGFLRNVAALLYIPECPHVSDAVLPEPRDDAVYVIPTSKGGTHGDSHRYQVVATAGNEEHRFFAVVAAWRSRVVVRGDACLACCLSLCQRADYHAVIL